MVVVKFRDKSEHGDLLKKVKKMRKFTDELEDMLAECYEDEDLDFRGSYRKEYDDDDMRMEERHGYRYGGYRRGGIIIHGGQAAWSGHS